MEWIIVASPFVITALLLLGVKGHVNKNGGSFARKQRVLKVIVSSQVYKLAEISKLTGIKEKSLVPTIQYIISDANSVSTIQAAGMVIQTGTSLTGSEVLKGARLDLTKMEIIMPERNADGSAKQEKWVCPYCRAKNFTTELVCDGCKARRQA